MIYDVCIIGGGINGAGIARDAAGRGLKTLLLEKGDLASDTSSASSKMIHGGLRYLEFYEFSLVRKSLAEREVMMRIAPQITSPLRFCIPHRNAVRPAWMVRAGLFIYDHLTRMNLLPKSETINLGNHPFGSALKNRAGIGFAYSDCRVDDARLVILNAMDAHLRGADIRPQTEVTEIKPHNGMWGIKTPHHNFTARCIVNAAGPYVRLFLEQNNLTNATTPKLRLVQGSHIVIPKLYDGDQCYLIQCPDKRVVFVWPYEGEFTLVGTTETLIHDSPENAKITDAETDYLLKIINAEFHRQTSKEDIIWSYSGVRPLFEADEGEDNRKATRDYKLILNNHNGAPILNVFGGKLTTYRPLAEEAVDMLRNVFPHMGGQWTENAVLPFIDFEFAPDDKTITHFIRHEWANCADDVLWRRTKWGLHMTADQKAAFKEKFDCMYAEVQHDKNIID